MSQATSAPSTDSVEIPSIPFVQIAPWALFFGLIALLALFFVSTDQGATSVISGTAIHEWVHDGRHLLGFPCH